MGLREDAVRAVRADQRAAEQQAAKRDHQLAAEIEQHISWALEAAKDWFAAMGITQKPEIKVFGCRCISGKRLFSGERTSWWITTLRWCLEGREYIAEYDRHMLYNCLGEPGQYSSYFCPYIKVRDDATDVGEFRSFEPGILRDYSGQTYSGTFAAVYDLAALGRVLQAEEQSLR